MSKPDFSNIITKPIIDNTNLIKDKRFKFSKWTLDEDYKLKELALNKGTKNWKKISEFFKKKSSKQCFYRWNKVIKPTIKENLWTDQEDSFISKWVSINGTSNWTNCTKMIKERTAKMCKDRWYTKLSLEQNNENFWSPFDELSLLLAVNCFGTSWSKIIRFFPSKTENQMKNKFYSVLRKSANCQLNKNDGAEKINVFDLKAIDLVIFLPTAINELKYFLGEDVSNEILKKYTFGEIQTSLKNNQNSCESANNSCNLANFYKNMANAGIAKNNGEKIIINLCISCRNKLKEQIKRKLINKMMLNQTPTDSTNNNKEFMINFDNNFNNNSSPSRYQNTLSKIEIIKDILNNFTHNITMKFA